MEMEYQRLYLKDEKLTELLGGAIIWTERSKVNFMGLNVTHSDQLQLL